MNQQFEILKGLKIETIASFLARGGTIQQTPKKPKKKGRKS